MSKSFQKTTLFDSEDDSDTEIPTTKIINVDNSYAQKYNDWRRKEVLQKLKDKYGDTLDIMSEIDSGSDKDSDSNEEDDSDDSEETGESLSDDPFDEDFFNVYGALKNKDPKIYDKNFKFYDTNANDQDNESEKEEEKIENDLKKNDKMTLQEYHKKLIKEKKGITEEDESMINPQSTSKSFEEKKNKPSYYEELYNIRKDIENVLKKDDETEDDNLFSIKDKTNNQKFVSNKIESNKQRKEIPNFWSNDNSLDENEKFLKNFILNKAYKNNFDDDDDNDHQLNNFEKYKNVDNHFKVSEDNNNDNIDECDPSESLIGEKLDVSKYHYEEPDATIIKRYPRNISSIRETENKTEKKSKRSEARLRKKQEKEQELKRLRKLKREEIENRIKTLKNVAGIEDLNFKDLDLNVIIDDDNDFDEEKYDRTMKTLFGDNYYNSGNDRKKPTFDFIPGIDDEPNNNQIDNNNKKKNKKEIKKQKDIMADDDIGLYEDLIGGEVATRFRYRIVEPNDFGLTDEEILYADDKELNKWCSLKKISQYRSKEKELYDRKVYSEKAKNMALKRKIFKSLYENKQDGDNDELDESSSANNDDYFKGQEPIANDNSVQDSNDDGNKNEGSDNQSSKKKRRKRKNNKNNDYDNKIQINNQSDNESIKAQIATNQKQQHQQINIPSNNNDNDCKKSRKRKRSKNKKNKIYNNDNGRPQQQQISGVSLQRLKAYGISNRELKKMKNK